MARCYSSADERVLMEMPPRSTFDLLKGAKLDLPHALWGNGQFTCELL